jgi:hypothetical protein
VTRENGYERGWYMKTRQSEGRYQVCTTVVMYVVDVVFLPFESEAYHFPKHGWVRK